jgi:hypothetical protein
VESDSFAPHHIASMLSIEYIRELTIQIGLDDHKRVLHITLDRNSLSRLAKSRIAPLSLYRTLFGRTFSHPMMLPVWTEWVIVDIGIENEEALAVIPLDKFDEFSSAFEFLWCDS